MGPHNLVGLIMPKAAYHSAYSFTFKYPVHQKLYRINIADDATPVVQARMETAHTNKCSDYECYNVAEQGECACGGVSRSFLWHGHLRVYWRSLGI